jgi:hypothetical protein
VLNSLKPGIPSPVDLLLKVVDWLMNFLN